MAQLRCPAWEEVHQQLCSRLMVWVGLARFVATIDQHPHHDQVVVDLHPDQIRGCAARASAPNAHPPGRSCRRCRSRTPGPARTASPAHRPRSGRQAPADARCADRCRRNPARSPHPTSLIDDLDPRRSLVRTHPDAHTHAAPSRLKLVKPEQAGHRHVEQHKPLPSLSSRGTPARPQAMTEPHQRHQWGSRKLAASRRTPGPSLARHRSCEKS
jgi:hypothetical protein